MRRNILAVPVRKVHGNAADSVQDLVAVEEPLEIRCGNRPVSITMRTPGHDSDLAVGFLFGEGIVRSASDVISVQSVSDNILDIHLHPDVEVDWEGLTRNFYMSSSCGVCGKASIEAVRANGCALLAKAGFQTDATSIHGLPDRLRASQSVFDHTGGLHAAALFDSSGNLYVLREDVGRHNAVDKTIGSEVLAGKTTLGSKMLFVSGRASFELVQKAVMAGIPMLAAVGAPSSLAVDLARRFQLTLLGFVRNDRFNIYSGEWRVS